MPGYPKVSFVNVGFFFFKLRKRKVEDVLDALRGKIKTLSKYSHSVGLRLSAPSCFSQAMAQINNQE